MKTHDNQKPFQCTVCNRGYNTAAALTSHMQNHKKQAALLNGLNSIGGSPAANNYSPRSTGSNGSSTSNNKRKYLSTIEGSSMLGSGVKVVGKNQSMFTSNSRLHCLYCTKSDFVTTEQLTNHVQTMHQQLQKVPSPQTVSQQSPLDSTNLQLSCEFCSMKFSSIQMIFQHLKMHHLDRISSPNAYLEHFNRQLLSNYSYRTAELAMENNGVKIELKSPRTETPTTTIIKQEEEPEQEQEIPTDLSQPKIRKTFKEEPNNNNNTSIESATSSPVAPRTNPTPTQPTASSISITPPNPGTFLCNQCSAALPDFESFRTHLKTHLDQGIGSYLCQHCGVAFHDQQIYEKHVFSHFLITNTEYCCTQNCNKVVITHFYIWTNMNL